MTRFEEVMRDIFIVLFTALIACLPAAVTALALSYWLDVNFTLAFVAGIAAFSVLIVKGA